MFTVKNTIQIGNTMINKIRCHVEKWRQLVKLMFGEVYFTNTKKTENVHYLNSFVSLVVSDLPI